MLDSFVYINQERVSRRKFIPNGVRFYLNPEDINQIEQAQVRQLDVTLSPDVLADFRYYVLVERQNYLQSEIIFSTYYQQDTQEIAKIQSKISLEGKIEQQICHDIGKNPQVLQGIIYAHYWLIGQMLNQLPLRGNSYRKWLPLCTALIFTILLTPLIFYFLKTTYTIKLLLIILLFLFFKEWSKRFLISRLRHWILGQLLFGIFSYQSKNRKIGFDLLTIFS